MDLKAWLHYLEAIHPRDIDMGMARVTQVYQRLNVNWGNTQKILVAGTNGKGTTCRMLESLAQQTGKRVGVFSSPHIHRYNERLRINSKELSDSLHCEAFAQIERVRGEVSLTFFEFSTLACLWILAQQQLDVIVIEVGLGGRLDATNVIDADIMVITTIGIDHTAFLGDTRDLIAVEKAGILRANCAAIIAEPDPPSTLKSEIARHHADVWWVNQDYRSFINDKVNQWQFTLNTRRLSGADAFDSTSFKTDVPHIPHPNAATGIATALRLKWPLTSEVVQNAVKQTRVPGRLEKVGYQNQTCVLDVAHNPHAATFLKKWLIAQGVDDIVVVVGMLKDKDIQGVVSVFEDMTVNWHCINLNDVSRGLSATELAAAVATYSKQSVNAHLDVASAIEDAVGICAQSDPEKTRIVLICGSFFSVDKCRTYLKGQGALL